ncbi:ferritin-like domain-containing protein [Ideonella sp.]|uniref:ferritin-like domain-containing protein n=1 Tax=Ideonella sp. TaxID=1929293 RepID=UPI0037C11B57
MNSSTAKMVESCPLTIDIEGLGLDQGALLLVRRALEQVPEGGVLQVRGRSPEWDLHLRAWCRQQGHGCQVQAQADGELRATVTRHYMALGRWRDAWATGAVDARQAQALAEHADPHWGLAARGASVERGAPAFAFSLQDKHELWAATAGDLYAQAAAAQWDPATAIDWTGATAPAPALEAAVVQLMTYLIENENAALLVPARHLGQMHPHFREVLQVLALQCADEARHIEVFTRRLALHGHAPGLSTAGGQASLKTLFEAPDFSTATFLLSVLGEGTFVTLLNFLHEHAPDPVTRQIARLAARDEARHVAFGMAHLEYRLSVEPAYQSRLALAVEQRFDELAGTAGLNEEVFDALVILAGGGVDVAAVARGHARVQTMKQDMANGRKARLLRLGFERSQAQRLADLHTRNFM